MNHNDKTSDNFDKIKIINRIVDFCPYEKNEYTPEWINIFNVKTIKLKTKYANIIQVVLNTEEINVGIGIRKKMWSSVDKGITHENRKAVEEAEKNGNIKELERLRGKYNVGLCKNTEIYGKWGEIALSKIFHLTVDTKKRVYGDKLDFLINNKKIDLKTATSKRDEGLIMAVNDKGQKIELNKDIYMFGYIENLQEYGNNKSNNIVVNLIGGIKKENISNQLYPSRISDSKHQNYEVPFDNLIYMESIVKQIHAKLNNNISFNYEGERESPRSSSHETGASLRAPTLVVGRKRYD